MMITASTLLPFRKIRKDVNMLFSTKSENRRAEQVLCRDGEKVVMVEGEVAGKGVGG
jgi:hypothetical protein